MSEPIYNHGIPVYGLINITIDGSYRPNAIADDGRKYSLHRTSLWKDAGPVRVRRYIREGMKFQEAELIEDWREDPRGDYYGVVRINPQK
jgi:hypothetical protein